MFVRSIATAAGLMLALAGAAQAQALGNYSGTQANGAPISMTLTADPNNNLPQITGFGLSIVGNCRPTGTVNTGWGFGPGTDITSNKAKFVYSFDYLWTSVSLTVSGSTVHGTVTTYTPVFGPTTNSHPTKAVFCTVPRQKFTMTYTGTSAQVPPRGVHYLGTTHAE